MVAWIYVYASLEDKYCFIPNLGKNIFLVPVHVGMPTYYMYIYMYRGVARILGRGVLSMRAQSARANFSHAHLRNGKVEVQIITENMFWT